MLTVTVLITDLTTHYPTNVYWIQNTFWTVNNSNPQDALSFDNLHIDDLGLWGDHMFPTLVEHLNALSHEARSKADKQ